MYYEDIIYKWKTSGFFDSIKLLVYFLRKFLVGILSLLFSSFKAIVCGDIISLLHEKKIFEKNSRSEKSDLLLFFPPFDAHYGDVINLLYFTRVVHEKTGKRLTVVSPNHNFASICKLFEHAEYIYDSNPKMQSLYWLMGPLYIIFFRKVKENGINFINHSLFLFFDEIVGNTTLSLFEKRLKLKLTTHTLSIPSATQQVRERTVNKIAALGFSQNQTVLVNLDARAIYSNISLNFWNRTLNLLVQAGFKVILNNKIEKLENEQIKYVSMYWDELIPVAEYCGTVISIRNGICDLLQFNNCKLIVIFPIADTDGNLQDKFYFRLSKLFSKELVYNPANLYELPYAPDLENELSSKIIEITTKPKEFIANS